MKDFIALDLETTGLSPKTDEIIEIGAVRFREGKEVDHFETLLNPGRKLEERITALTGICDGELEHAPLITEVLPQLLDFIGEDILLGHRILFDYSFIKKAAVNQKLIFEKTGIDTLKLSRKYLPQLPSKRLTDVCAHYEIPFHAHRASDDARACAALYFRLLEEFTDVQAEKPKQLIYRVKKEGPASKRQKERLYQLLELHKIKLDRDIDRLTKNEASRLTDQIIFRYGKQPHENKDQ